MSDTPSRQYVFRVIHQAEVASTQPRYNFHIQTGRQGCVGWGWGACGRREITEDLRETTPSRVQRLCVHGGERNVFAQVESSRHESVVSEICRVTYRRDCGVLEKTSFK